MRLAFLSSSLGWGGLERNLQRYAHWMQTAGHFVEVNAVPESPLANSIAHANFPLRLIARQRRYFPLTASRALKSYLLKNRFDALWIRDPRDLPLAALATRGIQCQLIFQQGMQIPQPKKNPWHRMRFSAVDVWVSPLECLRQEALKNTPLRPNQIHVIPLALENSWFEVPEPKADARASWNLPVTAKIIGLFGRIDPLKGQRDLLRALAEPEGKDWHAFIVGENTPDGSGPDHLKALKEFAKDLQVENRIHWRPQSDDLTAAYDCCDVYAMCSSSETFGMVTIEAMSRKVPVIGTRAGGTTELLDRGRVGKLYDSGDFKALAMALNGIDTWPMPRQEDLEKFHRSHAIEQWQDVLVDSRRSPL